MPSLSCLALPCRDRAYRSQQHMGRHFRASLLLCSAIFVLTPTLDLRGQKVAPVANAETTAPTLCSDTVGFEAMSRRGGVPLCCTHTDSSGINRETHVSCVPDAQVIGVQKGGTTALYGYIISHSLVQRMKDKEPHVLDREKDLARYTKKSLPVETKSLSSVVPVETTPAYLTVSDTIPLCGLSAEDN